MINISNFTQQSEGKALAFSSASVQSREGTCSPTLNCSVRTNPAAFCTPAGLAVQLSLSTHWYKLYCLLTELEMHMPFVSDYLFIDQAWKQAENN